MYFLTTDCRLARNDQIGSDVRICGKHLSNDSARRIVWRFDNKVNLVVFVILIEKRADILFECEIHTFTGNDQPNTPQRNCGSVDAARPANIAQMLPGMTGKRLAYCHAQRGDDSEAYKKDCQHSKNGLTENAWIPYLDLLFSDSDFKD